MFQYNSSKFASLQKAFSKERLDTYLSASGDDLRRALELHLWNSMLGGMLHIPIQHFELLLRNALNEQLTITYGIDWYDTLKPRLELRLQQNIDSCKMELIKMHRTVSQSRIIAQLTFGFWLTLLKKKYDTLLWRTSLYRAFPYAPKPIIRSHIHDNIYKIRELRNRIVHHEPIFQRQLDQEYNFILEVAAWICPDTSSWIQYHSNFDSVWENPPK